MNNDTFRISSPISTDGSSVVLKNTSVIVRDEAGNSLFEFETVMNYLVRDSESKEEPDEERMEVCSAGDIVMSDRDHLQNIIRESRSFAEKICKTTDGTTYSATAMTWQEYLLSLPRLRDRRIATDAYSKRMKELAGKIEFF